MYFYLFLLFDIFSSFWCVLTVYLLPYWLGAGLRIISGEI